MIAKPNFKKFLNSILKNATLTNVFIVGSGTLIVSGLGFAKEMIIANHFGLSELLDTFYIAILIPSFISGVFLGSFQGVFIPNYISEMKTGNNIGSFQSASFITTIGVCLFFLIIAFLFTDVYLETFFAGHTESYYELVKTQFYFVAPCILFWGGSSIINVLLTIDNEFTFSSLSSMFTPIAIIICLVFFKEQLGTIVLAIGTLIGSFCNLLFALGVALKRRLIVLRTPNFKSENIIILFKQLPAKLSASILAGINPIVDQYFSAKLIIGSIAALNYGIKIPSFAIGIISIAVGNVLLPYFSKNALDDKMKAFGNLKKILKYVMLFSGCLTVLILILSTPIIALIFERNAFTKTDTLIVSGIQKMYLLQIPFYIMGYIIVKFLTAINKNNFMVLAAVISLVLNVTLNYIFIKLLDVRGLALATSIVALINFIILYSYITHIEHSHMQLEKTN